MSIQADHRKLYGKFKFIVNIDGVDSAGFQSCSPIKINVEVMTYAEGGALVPQKEPGLGSFDNITLARGMSYDTDLYDWLLDVLDIMAKVPTGVGKISPADRRNLTINQRERDDTPAVAFRVYNAFPASLDMGDWNNEESGVKIETLELAIHFAERVDYGAIVT